MSSAISGTGLTAATPTEANGFAALSSSEFIKVMFTELLNQDPFAPSDSGALLEQLSSLRNIESQASLSTKLETLVLQNQISASGNLIGKYVEGLSAGNDQVSGRVTSVRIEGGEVLLELANGSKLPADRITEISENGGA